MQVSVGIHVQFAMAELLNHWISKHYFPQSLDKPDQNIQVMSE